MTETPFGVVVGQLARSAPSFPAVTCGEVTLSRAEFETRTNRLARVYRDLGVTPDSLVTIALPNGIGFFEAAIAAWKLGATPQPISSRLPPAERRAIVDLANPSLVVGVDPAVAPGRPTLPAGFEPDASLPADPLPPVAAARTGTNTTASRRRASAWPWCCAPTTSTAPRWPRPGRRWSNRHRDA